MSERPNIDQRPAAGWETRRPPAVVRSKSLPATSTDQTSLPKRVRTIKRSIPPSPREEALALDRPPPEPEEWQSDEEDEMAFRKRCTARLRDGRSNVYMSTMPKPRKFRPTRELE